MKPLVKIKRAYEAASKDDGYRVLVDRIWPRGLKKEDAHIELWAKDIAPTTELRKWFGHEPTRWIEFQKEYTAELDKNDAIGSFVEGNKAAKLITLVYAAKDEKHTHALVLKKYLDKHF